MVIDGHQVEAGSGHRYDTVDARLRQPLIRGRHPAGTIANPRRHQHPAYVTSGGRVQNLLAHHFSAQPFAVGTGGRRPVILARCAVAGASAGGPAPHYL